VGANPDGPHPEEGVGARNSASLCNLRTFMEKAAEPITSDDLDIGVDGIGKCPQ
jgi:hypothetical protein